MPLTCPGCGFELKPQFLESPEYHSCHVCGSEISALPFPACFAPVEAISDAELRRDEDDASCFYHDSKKAAHACSQCGRFLCALCAAEMGVGILCPDCIVLGQTKKKVEVLEGSRTLYDSMALMAAVVPALTLSFSIFGGPAAVYIAVRYWKRPSSIVRRVAWRKWTALALGLAQVAGWAWIIVYAILVGRSVVK